jgi:hypothetical protein
MQRREELDPRECLSYQGNKATPVTRHTSFLIADERQILRAQGGRKQRANFCMHLV